jgi:sugar-specific transcriptional regulator TrmB
MDNATVETIAKNANTASQQIYRIMPTLKEQGLVEQIVSSPTKYKALPLKDGLSTLLKRKVHKHKELETKTKKAIQTLKTPNKENTPQETPIIRVCEKHVWYHKLKKHLYNAQTSIDVIDSWKGFRHVLPELSTFSGKTAKRGVMTRLIIEEIKSREKISRNDLLEIRYVPPPPHPNMVIVDKKILLFTISTDEDNQVELVLWTNNQHLVRVFQEYFEMIWRNLSEKNHKKQEKTRLKKSPNSQQQREKSLSEVVYKTPLFCPPRLVSLPALEILEY